MILDFDKEYFAGDSFEITKCAACNHDLNWNWRNARLLECSSCEEFRISFDFNIFYANKTRWSLKIGQITYKTLNISREADKLILTRIGNLQDEIVISGDLQIDHNLLLRKAEKISMIL